MKHIGRNGHQRSKPPGRPANLAEYRNRGLSPEHVEIIISEPSRETEPRTSAPRIFTAEDLQTMTFPPLNFILPGLVPEGATLLVSRPKLGKSWLVLDLALATAAGRFTLGELKPASGDVLYLALEDGPRRLQRRLTRLLPTFSETWPKRFKMATEWPRAEQGLVEIKRWIAAAEAPRLVIVDTLAQFRAASTGKQQVYTEDYAAISGLQKLASTHNIAVVIVHHDRKSEADDVFDTVSGSLGLTGAADTILILKRQAGSVTMHVRGRDIEEAEKALRFDKTTCKWAIIGEASEVRRSDERTRVLTALDECAASMSPKDILMATGMPSRNAIDQLLFKMVRDGEVVNIGRGQYCTPEYADRAVREKDRKKERSEDQQTDIADETAALTNLTDLTGVPDAERSEPVKPVGRSRRVLS